MIDQPLLTIVLTGRNDGHGGDFISRCLRALEFNHRQLSAAAIAHEFVFVEWNPPAGLPLLADVIQAQLPHLGPAFRTYVADPRYQDALTLNPTLAFLEFAAKNVGIRRARGAFVLTSNCDIYLGRRVVDTFAQGGLETGLVYRSLRVDIKLGVDLTSVDWSLLEDERNHATKTKRLVPPLYSGGTGDFVLLDRESYHALGGFNEVYRVARIGIDANFLVKALSSGLRIADIGGPVYHVNHVGSFRLTRRQFEGREGEAPWGDSRWASGEVTYSNPDSWGLRDAPEREIGPHRTWLEFDWQAVPPLLDLKRIVLPARPRGHV